jgi:transcriptional regulator GlxA family with amidase domain
MKRVGLVVFPEFQILDTVAATVFEVANHTAQRRVYEVQVLSEQGGTVPSSAGVGVASQRFGDPRFDTLLMTGALEPAPASPGLLAFLREAQAVSRRTASICTGAFILAEAGLLDGRRATTHWQFARELQHRYPRIRVEEDRIFIRDSQVWTSAGMTACIDLALALVEEDLGPEISRAVARKMVVYHRRAGGQTQHSALLELEPKSDRVQSALSYAKQNLHRDLPVEKLAEAAHLSPRQFSRACLRETGQTPAKAVEKLRVEAARLLIESGNHSIEAVARDTGFADPERMRRAFLRNLGQPPQAVKRAARLEVQSTLSS